ncbi:hypothetical protein HG531_004804 [Fusarium graminearum]|nr:hypothetical protein HG531_004804 [Fusarium graminearum]
MLVKGYNWELQVLTSSDSVGHRSGQHAGSVVHELGTLAVAADDDLGARTLGSGLSYVNQVSHGPAASSVTSSEISSDIRGVGNTLHSQVVQANTGGEVVEQDGPNGSWVSNVARLSGSSSVNHGDGTAGCSVGQLVVGAGAELPSMKRVGIGGFAVHVGFEVSFELSKREIIINLQSLGLGVV